MDYLDFTLAAAVIFLAYLVRGISGFGSALVAVPLLAAGLYAGNHIHLNLDHRHMAIAIALLLIASGLSLLWRVLASSWPAADVANA